MDLNKKNPMTKDLAKTFSGTGPYASFYPDRGDQRLYRLFSQQKTSGKPGAP
jgi:hypothetical protein